MLMLVPAGASVTIKALLIKRSRVGPDATLIYK